MNPQVSQHWQQAPELAKFLLETHGGHLTVAMPLGLGKANHLINAIYQQVRANSSYSLNILTALSLQTPQTKPGLERNFFAPIADRLYSGYSELLYARDLVANKLPANVQVSEFFLQAGAYLDNPHAQGNYICANYSHASSYLLDKQIDLVIQMAAHTNRQNNNHAEDRNTDLSLSCNPDITLELLASRTAGESNFILIAELNDALPFMPNDAQLPESEFAHILEGESARASLFNVPKSAVDLAEYAAGFHASSLVRDGGTLQIGIGSVGDAVAHALIIRHQDNASYRQIITALNAGKDLSHLHLEPFDVGLYGVSEMLVDVFLDLMQAGVLKREVNGFLIQGGFFLGPNSMYQRLRDMPEPQRNKINMTGIGYINGTHIDFPHKQQNRQHARFINNAMKATLLGSVVSDGLDSGQVVSGVGGQYDFVRQSFALKNARSIIMLKALRNSKGKQSSNIVWSYGHTTIPRHLRDIVVSEYGIADLRGASDRDVVAAMLSITDSQFQVDLLKTAKTNGKIDSKYELQESWRCNSQSDLGIKLQPYKQQGLLPDYPFGTDFTKLEQRLIPVLKTMKSAAKSKVALFKLATAGLLANSNQDDDAALKRMCLQHPTSLTDKITRLVLLGALQK
ncbi:MAG: acyl-CoA hydrolase [Polaribacter sp.]